MSGMDGNVEVKLSQGENPGEEAVRIPIQPEEKEGMAVVTRPDGIPGMEQVLSTRVDAAPPAEHMMSQKDSSVPTHADSAMKWEYLDEIDVDPKSHVVVPGRKNVKLDSKKVKRMESVSNPEAAFPIYEVYMDWDDGGQWAWDGAYRQEVFTKKGLLIRVRRFKVENAKKWADLHSCRANISNPREASGADRGFQFAKACKLHHEEHGYYPNPNKLASMTLATRSECVTFLRAFLTPKTDSPIIPSDEEPEQQKVIGELQKILAKMKGITVGAGWIAGDGIHDLFKAIATEARRINVRQIREPDVTSEQLKDFQREKALTLEKLGEILGVKHSAVSRWMRGKSKMTEHHQRAVRQLLSLSSEQFAKIAEGEEDVNES